MQIYEFILLGVFRSLADKNIFSPEVLELLTCQEDSTNE